MEESSALANRSNYLRKMVLTLALFGIIFAPVRSAHSQTTTEYTLLTGIVSVMLIDAAVNVRIASDPSLWNPKQSVQVLREKLYSRTYTDFVADAQDVKNQLDEAIATDTRIPQLRGELQALQGGIAAEVQTKPGNTVGPTGQGVEDLLNDDATRAEWNQSLSAIRANLSEAIRILAEAESRGFCGDGICQSTEDCRTCFADCGIDQCTID